MRTFQLHLWTNCVHFGLLSLVLLTHASTLFSQEPVPGPPLFQETAAPPITDRTEDQVAKFLANVPTSEPSGPVPGLHVWRSEVFRSGDILTVVVAICVALCLMTPGVYLFYSSLQGASLNLESLSKSVSLLCILAMAWVLLFYSLAFSRNAHTYGVLDREIDVMDRNIAPGNIYIGELTHSAFGGLGSMWAAGNVQHPLRRMGDQVPHILFMTFQMMIYLQAIVPLCIVASKGIGEWAAIPFWLLWSVGVYVPLCYWTQGGGWLAECVDASSAIPVHLAIGFTALGLWWIKTQSNALVEKASHPIGLVTGWLLWIAGMLVLGGCRTLMDPGWTPDLPNFFLAGCMGHLTWAGLQFKASGNRGSLLWLFGPITGMVAISSGSASVSPEFAIVIGFLGSFAARLTLLIRKNEPVSLLWLVFAVHGVSALAGLILTGVFASPEVAGNDISGKPIVGLFNGNVELLRVQLLTGAVSGVVAFMGGILIMPLASFFGAILKRFFKHSIVGVSSDSI